MNIQEILILCPQLTEDDCVFPIDYIALFYAIFRDELPNQYGLPRRQRFDYNVNEVIKTLPLREQIVIRLRYGEYKKHLLREIGVKLGVSRERVRQIEGDALIKLRKRSRRLLGGKNG